MLYCYDNKTIKWENDGVNYCLHIWADNDGECNPRDYDHDSIMACFHKRYSLGDDIGFSDPKYFWNDLVWKYCNYEDVLDALVNKKLFDTCAIQYHDSDDDNDHWAICTNDSETKMNTDGQICFMMILFSIPEKSFLFVTVCCCLKKEQFGFLFGLTNIAESQ